MGRKAKCRPEAGSKDPVRSGNPDAGNDNAGRKAAPAPRPRSKKDSEAVMAEAVAEWSRWGEQKQESFLATLDAELTRLAKGLHKAPGLAEVLEVHGKIRTSVFALLHQHLHTKGAKHTGLQRAFQLVTQASRFHHRVGDAFADRLPQLLPEADRLAQEAEGWAAEVKRLSGVAEQTGPKVIPTRGKTAPGRLRRLDAFVCQTIGESAVAPPRDGVLVDLGFGHVAVTTVEMARMLWRCRPDVHVVGIEADGARAEEAGRMWREQGGEDLKTLGPSLSRRSGEARQWTCPMAGKMDFRLGGFAMPVRDDERPKLFAVRAMNVLRQYDSLEECRSAHRTVASQLMEGGLLFEGSSDPRGDVITAYVLRSGNPPVPEGLFFALNLRALARSGGLSLAGIGENLPQLLFARDVAAFEEFYARWIAAVAATDGSRGVRQHFLLAGRRLAADLPPHLGDAATRKKWLRRGWLLWSRPAYPA